MRAFVVAVALAVVTLGLVIFIFVNLHEATTASLAADAGHVDLAPTPQPPTPPPIAPTPPPPPPIAHVQPPTATAPPRSIDPLDQVVQGKTRREWRATYTARQKRTLSEIEKHQAIIDRATAGEEPDPIQLGEAHTRVRELNDELKRDQDELSRIEASPADAP